MKEVFRDITGYEGLYQVSNFGNVRSLNYNKTGQVKLLNPGKTTNGYLIVGLCKEGNRKHRFVHRLVAQTFIENPDNLPEVNHIDEDKTNNVVSNLEWCDRKYNANYGTGQQRKAEAQRGVKRPYVVEALSKKVIQTTLDYVFLQEWESVSECDRNGFCVAAVSKCCNNKYGLQGNVYNGFRWMFAEDYYKMFVA